MAEIKLPSPEIGATDSDTIKNLFNAYYMMKKIVEFVLQNLDSDNIKSVTTDELIAGKAKIDTALIETLEVGKNVEMRPDVVISWGQVDKTGAEASDIGAKPYDWLPGYGDITGTKPPINADNTAQAVGNRFTYIDQYGIYTGTLTANQVNTLSLAAEKLKMPGYPNNYGSIGGFAGDLILYDTNTEFFRIYNEIGSVTLKASDFGGTIRSFLNSSGGETYAYGNWHFSGDVTGVKATAVFG